MLPGRLHWSKVTEFALLLFFVVVLVWLFLFSRHIQTRVMQIRGVSLWCYLTSTSSSSHPAHNTLCSPARLPSRNSRWSSEWKVTWRPISDQNCIFQHSHHSSLFIRDFPPYSGFNANFHFLHSSELPSSGAGRGSLTRTFCNHFQNTKGQNIFWQTSEHWSSPGGSRWPNTSLFSPFFWLVAHRFDSAVWRILE